MKVDFCMVDTVIFYPNERKNIFRTEEAALMQDYGMILLALFCRDDTPGEGWSQFQVGELPWNGIDFEGVWPGKVVRTDLVLESK